MRTQHHNEIPVALGVNADNSSNDNITAAAADTLTISSTEEGDPIYCTFAVTGNQPTFQSIFVCNDCFQVDIGERDREEIMADNEKVQQLLHHNDDDNNNNNSCQPSPLCICQACADICHEGDFHGTDYIGMGPATCDCNRWGNCKIYERSRKEAIRLGILRRRNNDSHADEEDDNVETPNPDETTASLLQQMKIEVFNIPLLEDSVVASKLVDQANTLIRYTKETHWLDDALIATGIELSDLELLAWNIYQYHIETCKNIRDDCRDCGGAEWWVQVKAVDEASQTTCGSIDLHYDKDEALAESFGLGSFPTLSTVTYLTSGWSNSPPTIVLDHTYTQGEEEVMSQLLLSRPKLGKHLVFDGELLHGAPYHSKLLQPMKETHSQETIKLRVTVLVNIWKDRRPANVQILDQTIRQSLFCFRSTFRALFSDPLSMHTQSIPTVQLHHEDELPEQLQERIELPFVTDKGTLLGENNVESQGGLMVVTFPPPPSDEDSVLVMFGPGMQAYLEYVQEEEETTAKSICDELEFVPPSNQSEYV
jgi:hypothetical protein